MPEPLTLDLVQRWMQTVLVHPESAEAGIQSSPARALIDPGRVSEVVLASGHLTVAERLGIYQEMYLLRMRDALESDYPNLARHLGPHRFWHFVSDYVEAHPSRSYTLNRLGDHVPAFAATWGKRKERGLISDLSRLELALTRVFDAPEDPPVSPEALARLTPEASTELRLSPVAAFALERVRSASLRLLDSPEREVVPREAVPGSRHVHVLFVRKGGQVSRRTLEGAEGHLLEALTSGIPLGRALTRLGRRHRTTRPCEVESWFREWVEEGVFSAASLDPDP